MNVQLRPDHQEFIDRLVKSGRFPSADEAVATALSQMIDDEDSEALDPADVEAIRIGLEQAQRGETISIQDAAAHLRRRGINVH